MPDSFADISIRQQKDWLYGLCLRLEHRRQDADDLFQDTWLKALERFDTFDMGKPLRPWLARVCVNTYRDGLRRARRHFSIAYQHAGARAGEDIPIDFPANAPGPEEQAVGNAFKEALEASLETLDDKYRLPLILQYYSGISYDEISRLISLNPGTVKSRLSEAKKRLRRQMEALGYDEQA